MAILALLAAFICGGCRSLVSPHANAGLDIALVVPTQVGFLVLRVCPVAFHAACRTAHSPASEATDADAAPLAKRSYHATRILAAAAHQSNTSQLARLK